MDRGLTMGQAVCRPVMALRVEIFFSFLRNDCNWELVSMVVQIVLPSNDQSKLAMSDPTYPRHTGKEMARVGASKSIWMLLLVRPDLLLNW